MGKRGYSVTNYKGGLKSGSAFKTPFSQRAGERRWKGSNDEGREEEGGAGGNIPSPSISYPSIRP